MTPDTTALKRAKEALDELVAEQKEVVAALTELRQRQDHLANRIHAAKALFEKERDTAVGILLR